MVRILIAPMACEANITNGVPQLGDVSITRLQDATEVAREHYSDQSGVEVSYFCSAGRPEDWGSDQPTLAELQEQWLVEEGQISVSANGSLYWTNSADEIYNALLHAQNRGFDEVYIVTSKSHTSRCCKIVRLLSKAGVPIPERLHVEARSEHVMGWGLYEPLAAVWMYLNHHLYGRIGKHRLIRTKRR